ncbi:hypothetical protein F2Q69_00014146 [Brassica cretica]|uniref:Uncharacterized protein n=1 Tax=Brassica cretica TaxID=69181 RepID=A0A8S9QYB4_BRACR|nr:hypothetical protein F2Q69_00014146 [Brassica cretica]
MVFAANSKSILNMSEKHDSHAQSHCSSPWSHMVCGEYEPTISHAPSLQSKTPIELILSAFVALLASLAKVVVDEKSVEF